MNRTNIEVNYVDHMGTDKAVVDAARVSFANDEYWLPTLEERDENLIIYLAGHDHWSPFAHTSIKLKVKAPIFIARQLVKHQVGGVWNEVSRRYVSSEPEFWFPEEYRKAPTDGAKQGSSEDPFSETENDTLGLMVTHQTKEALELYNSLLKKGVAPELARIVLPVNTMTEWYWTGSLLFWARVCRQRLDPHAQREAQEFANLAQFHCEPLFPYCWQELMK